MEYRVLIIVQNLPGPFDRRVWLECQALISADYRVAVVCPKGTGDPAYEVVDTLELYKYRPYAPGGSKFSFVAEYVYSFLATAWAALKARHPGRLAVIQACDLPDIFWPLAVVFRMLERTRFVFDHHDLCPEFYESCFLSGAKLPYQFTVERFPVSVGGRDLRDARWAKRFLTSAELPEEPRFRRSLTVLDVSAPSPWARACPAGVRGV